MRNRLACALAVVSLAGCENWAELERRAAQCQSSTTCGRDGGAGSEDGGVDGGADAGADADAGVDAGADAGEPACGPMETRCFPGASGCRNLSTDSAHCGACGFACEGQPCNRGRCEPVELGQFIENPVGATTSVHHLVVADAVYVANANFRPPPLPDGGVRPFFGQVLKLNKSVFAVARVLADAQPTPQFLALRGDRIFYTNWESLDGGEELRSVGTSGSTSTTSHFTAPGGLFGLSAWENDLAFAANGRSTLFRWQEDGGVDRYQLPATGLLLIAASGPFAVIGSGSPAALWRVHRDGGDAGVVPLVPNLGKPWGLVIEDGGVFFTDTMLGTVNRVPLVGGDVVELASGFRAPRGLALDAKALYVVEHVASGKVLRIDRGDGGVSELASGQALPNAIAVDDEAIFWVNSGDGRVLRLRKRP